MKVTVKNHKRRKKLSSEDIFKLCISYSVRVLARKHFMEEDGSGKEMEREFQQFQESFVSLLEQDINAPMEQLLPKILSLRSSWQSMRDTFPSFHSSVKQQTEVLIARTISKYCLYKQKSPVINAKLPPLRNLLGLPEETAKEKEMSSMSERRQRFVTQRRNQPLIPSRKQTQRSISSYSMDTEVVNEKKEENDEKKEKGDGFVSALSRSLLSKRRKRGDATLGGRKRKFVQPKRLSDDDDDNSERIVTTTRGNSTRVEKTRKISRQSNSEKPSAIESYFPNGELPECLSGIEESLIERILMEVIDSSPSVCWDDIAGLQFAKKCVKEVIVWPMLRPDIFIGLRGPPKGVLLFGPPGTGKTLIGKAIASESGARFFAISASSLMSKWMGEGEKMVRTLFAVARALQPSVVFVDEIDSLLGQRSEGEMEGTRRVKTEFLVQLDGATTQADDRVLAIGATNRPHELDEAARRRFVKRLYIPLPNGNARIDLLKRLINTQKHSISEDDFKVIKDRSEGYSGADIRALCSEAALGPIRRSDMDITAMRAEDVRPIDHSDFIDALRHVRPSVGKNELKHYEEWNIQFGSFPHSE